MASWCCVPTPSNRRWPSTDTCSSSSVSAAGPGRAGGPGGMGGRGSRVRPGTEGSGRGEALWDGLPRAGVGPGWGGGLRGPRSAPPRDSVSPGGPRSAREWRRGGPAAADAPSRRRAVVRALQGAGARVREGGGETEGGGLGNPAGQGGRHGGVGAGAAVRRARLSHHQVLQERRQGCAQGVYG